MTTRLLMSKLKARGSRSLLNDATTICESVDGLNVVFPEETDVAGVYINGQTYTNATKAARCIAKTLRRALNVVRLNHWKTLAKAGRVPCAEYLDHKLSYLWLKRGYVNGTAIRNVIAAQEGCLLTRKMVFKKPTATPEVMQTVP